MLLKLAYFVEITWLLIDAISGYFQNSGINFLGNQTVSSIFRLGTLGLFFLIVLKNARISRITPIIFLLIAVVWSALHAIFGNFEGTQILGDMQFHMKMLMAILMCSVLDVQVKRCALSFSQVNRILAVNAAVLVANVFLGFLGIGFGQYGESIDGQLIGSKGFFYAGNEVSATMVAIFALILFMWQDFFRKNTLTLLLLIAIFFFVAILSLSKTSLIGFVLVVAFALYYYQSVVSKLQIVFLAIIALIASSEYWMPLFDVAIERWQFFFEVASGSAEFLTSGRIDRVGDFAKWLDRSSFFQLLFGAGQLGDGALETFENDLLDLIYISGFFGVLVYLVWIGWLAMSVRQFWMNGNDEGRFSAFMMALFLGISVIAGHVIYSAMLAPFIALITLAPRIRVSFISDAYKYSRK
ncbi:O-antigen ligase family protein [Noviherbaspirillum autotrophicum]|uniref:O-antigen polymerase n=1 Tax=Noviherbaspirillum autotrophicum TaxID=709839 RepID=A0A0C1YU17_9BURK|nr:hypothetical protein [Noviherbaspirillum autotrophicum]KIF82722.1 hypothetical protein TSA66_20860 [Noviherbaspirillum autotrophicum]KIF84172.1 hypothetical protein TSA66_00130 [Noviherbaspirillum autotrophicum]